MFVPPKLSVVDQILMQGRQLAASLVAAARGERWTQLIVCGFPRSGTSLLYNMLAASLDRFTFEPFEAYFMYRVHRLGNIASKAPLDLLHLSYLDDLNVLQKKTIVIVVVRDVRSLLVSRHPQLPDRYFIGWDHSWWPQNDRFSAWKYDAPGVIALHQAAMEAMTRHDVLLVRYEDLVQDPQRVQEQIAIKFQLRFSGSFSAFNEASERHAYRYDGRHEPRDRSLVRESSAVVQHRVESWRRPEVRARVLSQFAECPALHDVLAAWGYEHGKGWLSDLEKESLGRASHESSTG